MQSVSIFSIATVVILSISASYAASKKACEPVSLLSLKQELQDCISRAKTDDNATKWNACLVRVFNCSEISTISSGLSSDVKILGIFSSHRDQFFVDQRAYHFREVRDGESKYRVGFGYSDIGQAKGLEWLGEWLFSQHYGEPIN
ncbi:hypothetical protein [Chromobacterium subtsugae]|uniref:hypothetical protein n=1 Tax=Chromobacterium subtsugae TaxID=251747 RepID=UPI00128C2486|nr:hypothetical protein [Chromobacterium subtsugae]